MTLTTMIAELEEAERAATPLPWRALTYENSAYVNGLDICVHAMVNDPFDDGPCGEGGLSKETIARWHADANLIALMRNSLPTLIEALKRQGEALEAMLEEKCDYMRINNLGDPEAQHTVKLARAALAAHKEKSDV